MSLFCHQQKSNPKTQFICSFLAPVGKKRTKETPFKGTGVLENSADLKKNKTQSVCRIFLQSPSP